MWGDHVRPEILHPEHALIKTSTCAYPWEQILLTQEQEAIK